MRDAFAALRAHGTQADSPGMTLAEFEPLVRLDDHTRMEERYRA
jgi:hypothetical protein